MKKDNLIIGLITLILIFGFAKQSFQQNNPKVPKGFVFIPAGKTIINGEKISINAFLMSENEITNGQYQIFLSDLKKSNKMDEYEIAKIDTSLWEKLDIDGLNYSFKYHLKDEFPVVNISKEGAKLYCKWLTEQLIKEQKNEFRLPTKNEWIYAAKGGLEEILYPWGGPNVINKKNCYLAQFKALGLKNGPVEIKTFSPNNYGLYDLSGNAAEMIEEQNIVKGGSWNSPKEKIKINSEDKYEISPMIGFRPVITFSGEKKDTDME
jgi:formylglycine-generating enzyme required for sulfatase activity